jgi:hypothetical protein
MELPLSPEVTVASFSKFGTYRVQGGGLSWVVVSPVSVVLGFQFH